ncbi:GNAT family N-acetyltransferase [Maribellus mangrovi]|uniref:GNAT family N-acetyltransferase n=1 Tax=Maribellus mangrovi TaxID=3133146 RepID=UPI0030EBF7DB
MYFKTIENITIPEIAQLFNDAFADYFVKVEFTPELLWDKIESEDIRSDLSMGMFNNNTPVAFMLHGLREINGKNVAYNGGTGVIKEYRGQHVTVKMYGQLIPVLKEKGVDEIELEVIDKNTAAIKSYKQVGFQKIADLDCFSGIPKPATKNDKLVIHEFDQFDHHLFKSFWDWKPTWQNASETIKKLSSCKTFVAFVANKPVGYLSTIPQRARILQFAVAPEYRKQNIGSSLFRHFADIVSTEINVNNIDDPEQYTQYFLKKIGLKHFLTQHKMTLKL